MIELQNIRFSYDRASAPVLQDVSFRLDDGQCAAVLGNNGAGKSTLLKCIDRILRPQAGKVLVDGQDVFSLSGNELARRIADDVHDMTFFPQRGCRALGEALEASVKVRIHPGKQNSHFDLPA